MHMADALVSPTVGGIMIAASGVAVAYSVIKSKKETLIDEKKVPIMGIMSAFVFAAQMINFTIPGTGSSGHIGGGILLAALLGSYPSLLSVTAVLLIQALFFADGGLLALGCNVFNMGVVVCLIVYPLIFKPIIKKGWSVPRIIAASLISTIVGLQLGAFSVVLETLFSGVTALPFGTFVLLMQPIHLAIGAAEGLITAAVLIFVYKARPELLKSAETKTPLPKTVSLKKVLAFLAVATVLVGGGLSLFASSYPDGLEWSVEGVTGSAELEAQGEVYESAQSVQDSTAFMPDYAFTGSDSAAGTTVAGLVGGAMTIVLAGGAALIIAREKRRKNQAS
ncbi:MAG: energy-coupling factor ABC transporter permease [Eubacteriales bacterium]|nr:energy-coupling factor ABC transporter permease [Eubacteriales bacterium]